jgi:hypothetical protein
MLRNRTNTTTRQYEFIGRCDALEAEDLDAYDDSSREITNRTFRKLLGSEQYLEFEKNLGYDRYLRMVNDYHVSYSKGVWRGRKAICCFWSAYHHIFAIGATDGESIKPVQAVETGHPDDCRAD